MLRFVKLEWNSNIIGQRVHFDGTGKIHVSEFLKEITYSFDEYTHESHKIC